MASYADCNTCSGSLIQPDPDVSGVGVMIAFNLSAALALLSSVIASQLHGDLPKIFIPKLFYRTPAIQDFWIRVLDRLILGFSDQQLITGMAVLTIGLGNIAQISTYHFYVIESLAMFSCGCHLASVITLQRYFQEHPFLALVRVGAMLIFAIMLFVSIIYAGTFILIWFNASVQCAIHCTIIYQAPLARFIDVVVALILFWAYYSAMVYVFPNGTIFFQTWLVSKPIILLEFLLQNLSSGRHGYQFHERFRHWNAPIQAIEITFILQFVWSLVSFIGALIIRLKGRIYLSGSESQWSFGQILAVFLIVLPFLSSAEVFIEERKKLKRAADNLLRQTSPQIQFQVNPT